MESETLKPGIASSLSAVPPVSPSPRPTSEGTARPQAAASGWMTNESLSPTPPVECLSATGRSTTPFQSMVAPEFIITSTRSAVSRAVMPRQQMAIASALIWQSGISPAVKPEMNSRISAEPSARPSRFLSIIDFAEIIAVLYHFYLMVKT